MTPADKSLVERLRAAAEDYCCHALDVKAALLTEAANRIEGGFERVAQGWRSIESAPRDGTSVLLFEHGRDDVMETGRWHIDRERWVINNNSFWAVYPSHWQPLPPPPTPIRFSPMTTKSRSMP